MRADGVAPCLDTYFKEYCWNLYTVLTKFYRFNGRVNGVVYTARILVKGKKSAYKLVLNQTQKNKTRTDGVVAFIFFLS